jgi:hypothetical protein
MMKRGLLLCLAVFMLGGLYGQQLVSATYLGTKTKEQLTALFPLPFLRYGVNYYKVLYTSRDAKGQPDTLSGLMVVPKTTGASFPRLVYQHGTADCKACIPSNYGNTGGDEGQVGLLFAGMGFVSILPDYVGMGEGRGFQSYVHANTIVSATMDMLSACEDWNDANCQCTHGQFFITGYSQGGYASMALHQHLQLTNSTIGVTAASHMSGPYSISGVMRDLILSDKEYFSPAYIPNTVLGYNEVYDSLFTEVGDFFKPEYVGDILKYYKGEITITTLNNRLIQALKANTGASVGSRMIRDNVLNDIKTQPDHAANRIMRENDVYDWAPAAPTKIFYCTADDQVPYQNSIVARDTMLANGAPYLEVRDINPTANHGTCYVPAMTQTILFFLGFQQILSETQEVQEIQGIVAYPNPGAQTVYLSPLAEGSPITVWSADGQRILATESAESILTLDMAGLPEGIYFIQATSAAGKTSVIRWVKQNP